MKRDYHRRFSPSLGRDMEMLVFGHAGAPVLAFPTSLGRFYEWEDFGMVCSLSHHLEQGWIQLYCVDSVDAESWYNHGAAHWARAARHNQYEHYLLHEVVPLMRKQNPNDFLMAAGCSFGAYHAANLAFKHPGLIRRTLAVSGQYDLNFILHGNFNDDCYVNSPMAYLPNLSDEGILSRLRTQLQTILVVGGWGDICRQGTEDLARVLREKGIPHTLDVWEPAWHDWPWWKQMVLKHI
jgi:esterase/lipase superfamily enzyme